MLEATAAQRETLADLRLRLLGALDAHQTDVESAIALLDDLRERMRGMRADIRATRVALAGAQIEDREG